MNVQNAHCSASQLAHYAQRDLPWRELLQVDRHLQKCEDCAGWLARRADLRRAEAILREAIGASWHLPYEQLEAMAEGRLELTGIRESHVRACRTCDGELQEMKAFVSSFGRTPAAENAMQQQTSSEPGATSGTSWPDGWVSSISQLGIGTWVALLMTFCGWFVLYTLRVQWGALRQGVHFYDMADVLGHPARLFVGLEANRGGITTTLFILLCVVVLLAPLALRACRHRLAWLGWFAPLALMVCVALLLKTRTAGDLFPESGLVDTLGNDVRHFANHLFRGASAAVAQKVTVGMGGYLALAGSAYLAWCGIQQLRNGPELDREAS